MTSITIMSVSLVGAAGMGLQGLALLFYGSNIPIAVAASAGLWTGGMVVSGAATAGAAWLLSGNVGGKILPNPRTGYQVPNEQKLLPSKAGPVAHISPNEVVNHTPQEINDRALQLGLQPKGPDLLILKREFREY